MGILEPTPLYLDSGLPRQEALEADLPLDLLIMPGLAFDKECNRLGRGGGYYDCFLQKCRDRAMKTGTKPPLLVALAYNAQMVDSIPMANNDFPVDLIVTPEGLIYNPRKQIQPVVM
eukprot:CAMPEP_0196576532 /NCGR_PEP_ID=MMETSP1081-20130531/5757_1 /TAXON_ID=36882 /ORGANISM="Pyramimonas amylifera, Strain CCMP720" /LENGTH=116 /DNA_ID=CAMNT_0041895153 /DNA_START=483 /DNA_END=833 /DNA_ORIENTATION=-